MRSLWRRWQTLAILGRMVSQSRCPRMRELAIGRSGGTWFHAEGREHRKERAWHVLEAARGQNIAEVEESSER